MSGQQGLSGSAAETGRDAFRTSRLLKVLVLAGGPDRERPVSLKSGAAVAAGLEAAGHEVRISDVGPDDLAALEMFEQWGGDVVMPMLHGPWGEGGPLQAILDERGLPYMGTRAEAAALCMDKAATKRALQKVGLATPSFQVLRAGEALELDGPLVLKPVCEGSSIDLRICRTKADAEAARGELHERHAQLLAEAFVKGPELTVAVLGEAGQERALPVIHIVAAVDFYDYEAKYERDDTRYEFDDLPGELAERVQTLAVASHRALGCRHLSRVDVMVDEASGVPGEPMVLEVNTLPGFTDHSLVPKAAAKVGMEMAELVDRLAQMAAGGGDS